MSNDLCRSYGIKKIEQGVESWLFVLIRGEGNEKDMYHIWLHQPIFPFDRKTANHWLQFIEEQADEFDAGTTFSLYESECKYHLTKVGVTQEKE